MQTVEEIAKEIVGREGGFVNDLDDPGGATKHGVTIHTMRRLGLDLTGDGAVGVADVRALSRTQAEAIFIEHYFRRPRIGSLPVSLQASVFDMYVNAGGNAVKILQRLLRQMGHDVAVDGVIGPQTANAAQAAHAAAPGRREAGDQDPQESWMSVRAAELAAPKSLWVLTFSHGTKKVEFQ